MNDTNEQRQMTMRSNNNTNKFLINQGVAGEGGWVSQNKHHRSSEKQSLKSATAIQHTPLGVNR